MNNYKIIVINGTGASGKSTFISLVSSFYPATIELSMVDLVKEVASYIGWNGDKSEKSRKFLADIKDLIDDYDKSTIYKDVDYHIEESTKNWIDPIIIIFVNARSPEDIQYFVDKYNAKTLLITNPRVAPINSNHADSNVNDYQYDYVVENNSTLEDLSEKAEIFLALLKDGNNT